MKYIGYFRDVKNELYSVEIHVKNDIDGEREITLGGTPFITNMDGGKGDIYAPVKYQGATIEVVTEDYLFDIYHGDAQKVSVTLLKNGSKLWCGFVSPNLYNQGFEKIRELVEIECIDGLSTLKYFPYRQEQKDIRSLYYIIDKVLQQCNAYKYFYVSTNTQISTDDDRSFIENTYITENLFFDTKRKDDETDDDIAWKCSDVIEEICQYCGYTCFSNGENVYFVDYDAIKNEHTEYIRYEIGKDTPPSTWDIDFQHVIRENEYAENGANVSLDNVYNKVIVKADYTTVDTLVNDIWENTRNITAHDTVIENSTDYEKGAYGELVPTALGEISGNTVNNSMQMFMHYAMNYDSGKISAVDAVFVKYFYPNENYTLSNYTHLGNTWSNNAYPTQMYNTFTKSYTGAFLAKFSVVSLPWSDEIGELYVDYTREQTTLGNHPTFIDFLMKRANVSNIGLSKYLCLFKQDTPFYMGGDGSYEFLSTEINNRHMLVGGDNCYIIIKGSYVACNIPEITYPENFGNIDITQGKYHIKDFNQTKLQCSLNIGNKWWNGTQWQSTQCKFPLYFGSEVGDEDEKRADGIYFKEIKIRNTVNWRNGIDEQGYCIKLPNDEVMSGNAVFKIYSPTDYEFANSSINHKNYRVFLKDFEIKALIGDPSFTDDKEKETIYTIEIDEEYVNNFSEKSFKIVTYDDKVVNLNSVAVMGNDGKMRFLDKTYNNALSSNVNGEQMQDGVCDGTLRQEWWYCYKIYNQYREPAIKLNATLRNTINPTALYQIPFFGDKQFIIDTMQRNYRENKCDVTLVEKR